MAATAIPAPLKTADIQRFVVRAAQVEKAKPAAAYWCYYYVLEKVLGQGLHKTDDECKAYVVLLMDKVEQMKNSHLEDDTMRDDMAGKAYMEQFGMEVFLRADNAIRANRANKQTADTFQAASTFLDVLHVWPPVDAEITAKIKFAKYHAVRIIRAIKAGEDPNLSNPAPEPEKAAPPALDPDDPEFRAIAGVGPTNPSAAVGTAGDIQHNGAMPPQFVDQPPVSPSDDPISLPPYPSEQSSRTTQAMPHQDPADSAESYYQGTGGQQDVSPLPASDSGGYFPQVPPGESTHSPVIPNVPGIAPGSGGSSSLPPPTVSPVHPTPGGPTHATQSSYPEHPTPRAVTAGQAPLHGQFPQMPHPQPVQTHSAAQHNFQQPVAEVNDEAMARAQKHARFAISALNFEDVNTAVKELKAALADLGVR